MISEKTLNLLIILLPFAALFFLYVTYGYKFFFKKIPTYDTLRKLAIIQKAVGVIAAVLLFTTLITAALYFLGV